MVQGALGSDTGGSVRLPASFCGVSGLRPTVGRVPNHGACPVSATFDTIGPMARSVADVARILAVIAGPDRRDAISVDRPLENFLPRLGDGVAGVRIGVPRNFYFDDVPPDIAGPVLAGLRELEAQGARLVEVEVPGAEESHIHATKMIFADACAHHADRLDTRPEDFSAEVRERMLNGRNFTAVDYAGALRAREAWRRTLADLFEAVDILASPTTPADPPPVADDRTLLEATRDATRNTYAGGLGAIPGLSVPCGFPPPDCRSACSWRPPGGMSRCCSGPVTPISRRASGISPGPGSRRARAKEVSWLGIQERARPWRDPSRRKSSFCASARASAFTARASWR